MHLNVTKVFFFRIPPETPITIHQKALFTFWLSCILLMLIFKIYQLMMKLSSLSKSDDVDGEVGNIDEDKNDGNLLKNENKVTGTDCNLKDDPLKDGVSQRGTHKKDKDVSLTDIAVNTTAAKAEGIEKKLEQSMKGFPGIYSQLIKISLILE